MNNFETKAWLESRWEELLGNKEDVKPDSEKVWEEILRAYQEPHRAYHTLDHVRSLLELWEAHKGEMEHPEAVALAIWFHDLVYDPFRKDNEEKSAVRAKEVLQHWRFPEQLVDKVVQLIEDTAGHQPSVHDRESLLFLDMDLSILGTEEGAYMRYADQIRQEYKQVPDALYILGRQQILYQFLKRTNLYFTPEFRDRLEVKARNNLAQELQRLEAP